MRTIILYISKDKGMKNICRYFLDDMIATGEIYILEYRKDGQKIEKPEKICEDILKKIRYTDTWKLLMIDDSREGIEVEKLYHEDCLFRKIVAVLLKNIADGKYHITFPFGIYMIFSIASSYSEISESKKKCDECANKEMTNLPVFPRMFIYNFLGDEKRIYEVEEIIFFLIILYFSADKEPVDHFCYSKIYEIKAEWNWRKFHDFLRQLEEKCQLDEEQIKKRMPDMSARYSMPMHIDSFMKRYYNEVERKAVRKAISLDKVIRTKEEFLHVHNKMMEEVEKQFEKIRGIHLEGFSIEQRQRAEIYNAIKKYEMELVNLFHEEVLDFEWASKKLEEIEKKTIKCKDYKRVDLCYLGKISLMIGLVCYGYIENLPSLLFGIAVFLILFGGRIILPVQTDRILSLEERVVWSEVEGDIERENQRIEKEIKYMHKYMRNYYLYYMTKRQEEERKKKYNEELQKCHKIEQIKQLLIGISKLQQSKDGGISPDESVNKKRLLSEGISLEQFPFVDISIDYFGVKIGDRGEQ